jgi:broad specificity phosphatase PhoE
MIWLLFLLGLNPGEGPVLTLILVRHSEKLAEKGQDPPLSTRGLARSQALASFLKSVPLDGIITTPYQRTQQTAAPILAQKSLPATVLAADAVAQHLLSLKEHGGTYLVCGHSNTIPAWLSALGCASTPLDEGDYSNLFVLTLSADSCQILLFNMQFFGEPSGGP